ncbi:MAG: hypothetical protein NTW28_12275 [Candidatus Solibacter sp.]|nr:hypothetical protein [Candidatus Solibacter sp.]
MNATEEYTQPLGLDIGTSRIVVARNGDKNCQYDSLLNAFLTIPYSKLAESLLQREDVFHEVQGSDIVVAGNEARKFAEIFHLETRRPMLSGVLNPHEPHSLAVIRRIIAKLLGQLGYAPTPIQEGLAVVFGELATSNFTGIGVSCGSGLCNACLAVLSVPVLSFSVPKAGDFIDSQAAAVTGDLATRLRVRKEQSFRLNGLASDRTLNALTVYYQEVIANLTAALRTYISATQRLPKLDYAIPLVLSGGTVMPKGFLDHFSAALRAQDFPIRLSEVRLSPDPLNSTARGALMAALC